MQFVELENTTGHKLWVNPAHVEALKTDVNKRGHTDVIMRHGNMTVKGVLADIAKQLNDALKT
jgi:hypothetical protein